VKREPHGKSLNRNFTQGRSSFMNTPDRSLAEADAISIAELEARFEMQAVPLAGNPVTDWKCSCSLEA
jgi:hypothetical protein